ncbi:hypothetical protein D3C81_2182760 [compost metagenome]
MLFGRNNMMLRLRKRQTPIVMRLSRLLKLIRPVKCVKRMPSNILLKHRHVHPRSRSV